MRMLLNDALDRAVPIFVLPYATWTAYVHLITATHSSFNTLLQGLPFAALIAVAATIGWFHLAESTRRPDSASDRGGGATTPAAASTDCSGSVRMAPFIVLALAMLWTGLLAAGMPYPVFWWVALTASFCAWVCNLRGTPHTAGDSDIGGGRHAAKITLVVAAAAIGVTLAASRPDPDDAFHLSIPATLLRFPQQPVLLHDTLYRLPDAPILTPFYRLGSYDVLIGTLSRITGIDHLAIAYLLLPSLFAALCVLAWAFLLRRIVPARWPSVLLILFLCVLALGEAHRAYGNFAFVRLFQGKAILATCMIPAITGSALLYARNGGIRYWLLLFAAQIAALGLAASALFAAPAAAALGLAGGWSANTASSRRFATGILASAYVFAAAWVMTSATQGGHGFVSPNPMPTVPWILEDTWGSWSTGILLVALLAAWSFVRDRVRARYLSAGAFFFLLTVLNPYTCRFVADHLVGVYTYWRLTWALPLPLFLAVLLDGVIERAPGMRWKLLARCACLVLAGLAVAFGWHFGTLRGANSVTLGMPGLKVYPVEYPVARQVAEKVPEHGVVLAPELVALWLPTFVVHPQLVGARIPYLTQAFAPAEAKTRRSLMLYVAGQYRPPGSAAWFAHALQEYGLTAVVFVHSAPWRAEMAGVLESQAWRPLSSGAYEIWVKEGSGPRR